MKFYLILIFVTSLELFSGSLTTFHEANANYRNGEFEKAAELYESLVFEGYESVGIYHNLGNSYYKTGDVARAIVNYERALKLSPGDRDILENLNIVRFSLIDKTEEEQEVSFFTFYSDLKKFFNIHSAQNFFYHIMLFTAIAISACILLKNTVLNKLLSVICIISIILLAFSSMLYYDIHQSHFKKEGIISQQKVAVLSSPYETPGSDVQFFLHLGTKASILRSNKEWVEISLGKDKRGWIKKDHIIEI
ncbi:MAG: tetratricopeptide repeat protein [Candidatus Delongbacteria bacterium]